VGKNCRWSQRHILLAAQEDNQREVWVGKSATAMLPASVLQRQPAWPLGSSGICPEGIPPSFTASAQRNVKPPWAGSSVQVSTDAFSTGLGNVEGAFEIGPSKVRNMSQNRGRRYRRKRSRVRGQSAALEWRMPRPPLRYGGGGESHQR